jgi:hypothetical protein
MATQVLTPAQIDQFISLGWCAVEDCFSPKAAKEKCDQWILEHGFELDKPENWGFEIKHSGLKQHFSAKDYAPKAWAAAEDLVGKGAFDSWTWGGFIVNRALGRDKPWALPPRDQGWHVDGDFFRHFLDSPEQGLLILQVFTDMGPQGGGTAISEDSYPTVAQVLYEHPEGLDPVEVCRLPRERMPFKMQREVTCKAGTVVFCHPFIMHASSPNCKGGPRFAMNAPISLKAPMKFNNRDTATVVERSIIDAVGGKPFDFKITRERERIIPDRLKYTK